MTVKPIPDGYHTLTPHLIISDAARALDFYKEAFGVEELYRLPAPDGKLLHASIRLGDSIVMMNDPYDGQCSPQTLQGSPVILHVYVEDANAAFDRAVGAGARVVVPLGDMPWGDRYGVVADPFGHTWAFASRTEEVGDEELMRRLGEQG